MTDVSGRGKRELRNMVHIGHILCECTVICNNPQRVSCGVVSPVRCCQLVCCVLFCLSHSRALHLNHFICIPFAIRPVWCIQTIKSTYDYDYVYDYVYDYAMQTPVLHHNIHTLCQLTGKLLFQTFNCQTSFNFKSK